MSTTSKAKTAEQKEKEKQKIKDDFKWTLEQEELLAEWAEKAACYRWLHSRAEKYYSETLSIPMYFGLRNSDIEKISKVLKDITEKNLKC